MKLARDNIIKNALIIAISIVMIPILSNALNGIQVAQLSNFLLIISMLLVTVCFAAFAFTYEKSNLKTREGWFLAHGTTFVLLLLIALLLESLTLAVRVVYPSFYMLIFGFSFLLYLGVVLYDFWDFFRAEQ